MGHWTDELLELMVTKLTERKEHNAKPAPGVSTEALAAASGGMIEIKHGD